MPSLEDALLAVYRQALVENKKSVSLESATFPVRSTAKRKLKQVDFQFEGRQPGFHFESEVPDPTRILVSVLGRERNGVYFT